MENENTVYALTAMAGSFRSGSGIGTWLFDQDATLYFSTSPQEQQYRMFLEAGGILEAVLKIDSGAENPFLLNDDMGLMWLGEYARVIEKEKRDGRPDVLFAGIRRISGAQAAGYGIVRSGGAGGTCRSVEGAGISDAGDSPLRENAPLVDSLF